MRIKYEREQLEHKCSTRYYIVFESVTYLPMMMKRDMTHMTETKTWPKVNSVMP
jgi:hypothetical protein